MMWTAIRYASSGLTLAACLAAIILAAYRRHMQALERMIAKAPASERAQLAVSILMKEFSVDTTRLTKEQAYNLALVQIRARGRRYLANAIVVLAFLLVAAAAFVVSLRNRLLLNPAAQMQLKIKSPTDGAEFPEKYEIAFGNRL